MADFTYTPDNILSKLSEKNPVPITVATGQGELKRGTLLISLAGTDYIIADTDDTFATTDILSLKILSEDIDATSAAVETNGYRSGNFNAAYITFGGTDTADDWKLNCRNVNIYLDNCALNSLS